MKFKVLKILCILLTVNCLWVEPHLIFRQSVNDSDVVGGGGRTGGLLGAISKISEISKDLRDGAHKMRDSVLSGICHTVHKLGSQETKVGSVLQEVSTEPVQTIPPYIDVRITFEDDEHENADRNDEPGTITVKTTTETPEATTVEITLDDRSLFDAPSPCPSNYRMAKDGNCRIVQS